MGKYVAKRVIMALPLLFGITVVIYFLLSIVPGGPLDVLKGSELTDGSFDYENLKKSLGLDRPVYIRYIGWLRDVIEGDLGSSYRTMQPVTKMISQRIGPSVLLTGSGTLAAIIISIPIGIIAAYKPGSKWDGISSFFALAGATLPRFFIAILAIYIFGVKLAWLPTMGMHSSGNESLQDLIRHLILPSALICFGTMGGLIKQTRSACLEIFNQDYMRTARAKGIGEFAVVIKHGFRNALTPVITTILLHIPEIIGGSTITERIFGWPGIGSLMIDSISNRDYPVVMGIALLISVTVLITNLALDIAYGLLDPRVTYDK